MATHRQEMEIKNPYLLLCVAVMFIYRENESEPVAQRLQVPLNFDSKFDGRVVDRLDLGKDDLLE